MGQGKNTCGCPSFAYTPYKEVTCRQITHRTVKHGTKLLEENRDYFRNLGRSKIFVNGPPKELNIKLAKMSLIKIKNFSSTKNVRN